jgi:hypothetical protein
MNSYDSENDAFCGCPGQVSFAENGLMLSGKFMGQGSFPANPRHLPSAVLPDDSLEKICGGKNEKNYFKQQAGHCTVPQGPVPGGRQAVE